MFDRKAFFLLARGNPLGRVLTQEQVDGIDRIFDEWEARWSAKDTRCLAYILATAFHETDGTFQPVREGSVGGRRLSDAQSRAFVTRKGYRYAAPVNGNVYYGRGLVQLTWIDNYRKLGQALGVDLVANPELACDPVVAVRVLFEGMFRGITGKGDFTGKALEDYFSGARGDLATTERQKAVQARRIVNGTDRADLIAGYFVGFLRAVDAATKVAPPAAKFAESAAVPDDEPSDTARTSPATSGTVLAAVGASAAAAAPGAISGIFGISSPWAFAAFALATIALLTLVYIFRREIAYKAGV